MSWADALIIQEDSIRLLPQMISDALGISLPDAEKYRHPGAIEIPIIDYVIEKYTAINDRVIDPMCGIGTVVLRALQLKRDGYGMDVVNDYVNLGNYFIHERTGFDKRIKCQSIFSIDQDNYISDLSPIKLFFFSPPQLDNNRGPYPNSIEQIGNFKTHEFTLWLEKIQGSLIKIKHCLGANGYLAIMWRNEYTQGQVIPIAEMGAINAIQSGFKMVEEKIIFFKNPKRHPEFLHIFKLD